MKQMKTAILTAALVALPAIAQAQTPMPGFYIGAEGGLNWMLNFNANTPVAAAPVVGVTPGTGWMAGGVIGYDFVGPRVELEGIYRWNPTNIGVPGTGINNQMRGPMISNTAPPNTQRRQPRRKKTMPKKA